jgi:nucleoside-diphosphate-sugar epimerase
VTSNLVFGATGAIGCFLLPKLRGRGERVVAVSRQPGPDRHGNGIEWLRADLFAAMPPVPPVETVYSLGPLDAFARWFAGTNDDGETRRLVAISSMSAESKQDSVDAGERELAARLRDAEERVLSTALRRGIACTIFRPTLIYGGGSDRSLAPLARFARRWHVLPIPLGASGLRQPVHAADLAHACIAVLANPTTFGRVYALGGGERLRFDAMLAQIARTPARSAIAVPVPIGLLRVAMRGRAGALSRLRADLVADNGPAEHDFGYAPRAFAAADVLPEADATA